MKWLPLLLSMSVGLFPAWVAANSCPSASEHHPEYDRADALIEEIEEREVLARARGHLSAIDMPFEVVAYGGPAAGAGSAEFAEDYSSAGTALLRRKVNIVGHLVQTMDAAMRRAVAASSRPASAPPRPEKLKITLYNFDYPRGVEASTGCYASSDPADASAGECTMWVFKNLWQSDNQGLKFTLAHELFHVLQQLYYPAVDHCRSYWWVEGAAEWFANLAVPGQTKSTDFVRQFDDRSDSTPLNLMDYDAVVYFLWAGEKFGAEYPLSIGVFGNEWLADAGRIAAGSSPIDWANFTASYLNGEIVYPDGRSVLPNPDLGTTYILRSGSPIMMPTPMPLTIPRIQMQAQHGRWELILHSSPTTTVASESGVGGYHYEGGGGDGGRVLTMHAACDGTNYLGLGYYNNSASAMTMKITPEFQETVCVEQCYVGEWYETSDKEQTSRAMREDFREGLREEAGVEVTPRVFPGTPYIGGRDVNIQGDMRMSTSYRYPGPKLTLRLGGSWKIDDPQRILTEGGGGVNDRQITEQSEGGSWQVNEQRITLTRAFKINREVHTVSLPGLPMTSGVVYEPKHYEHKRSYVYNYRCDEDQMFLYPLDGGDERSFTRVGH